MDVLLMKLDPAIPGTSTFDQYAEQIELLSFSHGVRAMRMAGDIGGQERTAGKPGNQDFTVTKYFDKSSPSINVACCKGEAFKSAEVTIARNDGGKVLPLIKYTLKDVVLSSVSVSGGGGDKPIETVAMNFNHISWDFYAQDSEGDPIRSEWDVANNTAG